MDTIVDLTNCDAWADALSERCANRSTELRLADFFKLLYKHVMHAEEMDVSDRSKLKLDTSLVKCMFMVRTPKRALTGYRLRIKVVDPKGRSIERVCYLATTHDDLYYNVYHASSKIMGWSRSR